MFLVAFKNKIKIEVEFEFEFEFGKNKSTMLFECPIISLV